MSFKFFKLHSWDKRSADNRRRLIQRLFLWSKGTSFACGDRAPHLRAVNFFVFCKLPLAIFEKSNTIDTKERPRRAERCESVNLTIPCVPDSCMSRNDASSTGWMGGCHRAKELFRGVISHPLWQREIVQHAVSDFQKSSYF